jgi:hypothetical protein
MPTMPTIPQSQLPRKALPSFIKLSLVTLGARLLDWPVSCAGGSVAVYPNTGNPLRLADYLAGLLPLLHEPPALIPTTCGAEGGRG